MRFVTIILVLACLVAVPAQADDGFRDLTDDEYAETLRLFMADGLIAARAHLDALEGACAGRPLYLLARARLELETLAIDDDDREKTAVRSRPGLALLDEVIARCDEGLDRDGADLGLRYYRGWAWMMKSQFKAFGRDFYGAGRDAGKGKSDLEAYLAAHPDDPVPNGLLGAYLYFTDAVPKLFQFLSKLLFLPTGDRDRGLDMIRRAVEGESPVLLDFQVLDANVTFFFEGRFEEGLDKTNSLLDRFPQYPRLALASAVAAPLDPFRAAGHLDRVGRVLEDLRGGAGRDSASLSTVHAFQGWALRLLAGNEPAREFLEAVVADPPPHPDWAAAFARLHVAHVLATEGRYGEARRMALPILEDDGGDRFADQARLLLDDLEGRDIGTADPVRDAWIGDLYGGDRSALTALRDRFATHADSSVRAAFYAADARLLAGDRDGAARGFRDVYRRKARAWERPFQLLAAMRIGEILAAQGNFRAGANWMKRAAEENQDVYRLKWLMQGRQRHFLELGESGAGVPALLTAAP